MVDTPNNKGNTGNIRVRKIRAGSVSTRDMQVERLTVNTGETRSAESDMMEELKDSINEQTDTLQELLKKIHESVSKSKAPTNKDSGVDSVIKQMDNDVVKAINVLRSTISTPATDNDVAAELKKLRSTISTPTPTNVDYSIKSLDDDLVKAINELRAAIVTQTTRQASSGDEGGGGGGGGGSVGDAVAAAKMIKDARDQIDEYFAKEGTVWNKLKTNVDVTSNMFYKLAASSAVDTIEGNFLDLATVVQRTSSKFVDLSNVTEGVTKRFTSAIDSSESGIVNMTTAFFDFIPALSRGGDNFEDTMALIRNSVGQNLIGPMGTIGGDFSEVSRNIRSFRLDMRDKDVIAFDRMGFKESNESLVMLFDLERRRSISADINDSTTARNMQMSLGALQMIAHNTGQSVVELLKANRSSALKIANIGAAGVLSDGDVKAYTAAANLVGSQPGMEAVKDLIVQLAMSGGSPELMLSENPEIRDALTASGNAGFIDDLKAVIQANVGKSDTVAGNDLMGFLGNTKSNNLGVSGANIMKGAGADLFGALSMARTNGYTADQGDQAASMFTSVTDFFDNVLGSNGALITALISNGVAVWANTAALLGKGGLFGLIGKGFGKIGGVIGKIGRSIRGLALGAAGLGAAGIGRGAAGALAGAAGIGRGAAGAAGLGAAALGVGKVGLGSILRAIPGIGAIAGLGYGAYKAMQGDWVGAGLSAGAGLAGLVPGFGTAASVGLSASLAAHEMGVFGEGQATSQSSTVAPPISTTNATINQGMRNDTQRLLLENNRLISRMIELLVDGNVISDDIRQNTARAMVSPDPSLWARLTGSADDISPHSGG